MPSLHGAGVSVHLATQPLAPTLTESIQVKKGTDAATKTERAEKALQASTSSTLAEEVVPFPGDDDKFALTWLADAPFKQVVIGRPSEKSQQLQNLKQKLALRGQYELPTTSQHLPQDVAKSSEDLLSSADVHDGSGLVGQYPMYPMSFASSRYTIPREEPKALLLHVNLSEKTFSSLQGAQHLRIDVFFNGQLSSSTFLHMADIRTRAKSLNQVFAGTRTDYMAERPWVIHTTLSGSSPAYTANASTGDAQGRWEEICAALKGEAETLGFNAKGDRPPTAGYLLELASMQMPDMVSGLQKPGGMKFGVIDVIVVEGKGRKLIRNGQYLKSPKWMPDDRFGNEASGDDIPEPSRAPGSACAPLAIDSDEDAEGESDDEFSVLSQNTVHHGLPNPSAQFPPSIPPQRSLPLYNPFSGSPIRGLAGQPSTPLVRGNSLLSGSNALPATPGLFHPSGKAQRGVSQHMPSVQRTYPSAHAPSVLPRNPFPSAHAPFSQPRDLRLPSAPPSEQLVNPYKFDHADRHHKPLLGSRNGLDTRGSDDLASSPLRHHSGGQLTLPSIVTTPEDAMPSPFTTSVFSSPHSLSSGMPGQDAAAVFSPDSSAMYTSIGHSAPDPSQISHTNVASNYYGGLHGLPRPAFHPKTPYASLPYQPPGWNTFNGLPRPYFQESSPYVVASGLPPRRNAPSGPPPPLGIFTVTENRKVSLTEPKTRIPVRHLVIRCNERVVLSHHFVSERWIPVKAGLDIDTPAPTGANPHRASQDSVERARQPTVSRHSSGAAIAVGIPSETSFVIPTPKIMNVQPKRDSIHDLPAITETPETAEKMTSVAAEVDGAPEATSPVADVEASTKIPSDGYEYVPKHRTALTGIRGVQGPKATEFVFDNPEELLRKSKKRRSQTQSCSASPTKLDEPKVETPIAAKVSEQSRETAQPVTPNVATIESSSPLSELSHTPSLSISPDETKPKKHEQSNHPTLPSLAAPTPAMAPTPATPAPQVLPNLSSAPTSPTLKRKRGVNILPKRNITGAYTRPQRSPDRLSARENPPLNRNCVIAYAVSEEKGGALRQVKSERKGIFKEEGIVVGCRFFIPGFVAEM